ncbi:MAG: membrane protein insertion efficiency factor YidD [Candidatus Omnitrophota bacterium]
MASLIIYMIKLYQRYLSPLFMPRCRHFPSCSEYSIQAIKKFGLIKGTLKSFYRIIRCNPFVKSTVDIP